MNLARHPTTAGSPRRLGRHRVIAKLGQGGMADVYLTVVRGQHGVRKLLVAKVLRRDLGIDEDIRAMFVKEACVATLLSHRNLVQSFEVDEADGHHYITMEYLDGRPLHVVLLTIGRENMPLQVHVAILAFALAGLHAAHELKDLTGQKLDLVHRDVSPQNVFVTYDGEVKVVDFGIAKVRGAGTIAHTGEIVGKIGYMAPEQALSQPVDCRADIFAVGVMLWEALARRSFVDRGESQAASLYKRVNGNIPSPRTAAPDAPDELLCICERAIAAQPDDRFPTAAAFEEALVGYLDAQGARVGAKEIAALMAAPFEQERAQVRALIQEHLAAPDDTRPSLDVASMDEVEAPVLPVPLKSQYRWIRPSKASRLVAIGAVLLGTAGVGVLLVVRSASVTPSAASQVATPSSATGGSAAPPLPEGPKRFVRIRVAVTPLEAELVLDGKPLGANPFVDVLPFDSQTHVLAMSAKGYVTMTRELRLDADVDVQLALVHETPGRRFVPGPDKPPAWPTPRRVARPVDDKDPYAP
jgi:serine/threonine-protein kinase